jgi:hypothetical protein
LTTQVFPVTRAAPDFQIAINTGEFHGVIKPTTPNGWRAGIDMGSTPSATSHKNANLEVALSSSASRGHVFPRFHRYLPFLHYTHQAQLAFEILGVRP